MSKLFPFRGYLANAVSSMGVQVCVVKEPLWCIPSNDTLGSHGSSVLIYLFLEIAMPISMMAVVVYTPTNNVYGKQQFLFSQSLPTFIIICFLDLSHSHRGEENLKVLLTFISLLPKTVE